VISDHSTAPRPSGKSTFQGNLFTPASSVLELRHVSCAYETGRPAVQGISFAAREGEILCLLGPSGCGKTTILRAIAGFEPVRSGQLFLSGQLVSSPDVMTPTENRRVGMVFQEYALFPHLRIQDNIAFGLHHLAKSERAPRVQEMLRLTGLEGFERRYPHELSASNSGSHWLAPSSRIPSSCCSMSHSVIWTLTWPGACAKSCTISYGGQRQRPCSSPTIMTKRLPWPIESLSLIKAAWSSWIHRK
jgi:ATPase subunit of ABC transporter with duplicated ATPase domains